MSTAWDIMDSLIVFTLLRSSMEPKYYEKNKEHNRN